MFILFLNTSERAGGAAIAANRLMQALQKEGVETTMLCRTGKMSFYLERLRIFAANGFRRERLWYVDIANVGQDITQTEEFKRADVVHLHYINQGFLSLSMLDKIFRSGKRIVWTMHDMWPYTGICHHADECRRFQEACHHCPLLLRPDEKDLSAKVFETKRNIWDAAHITFVGCSQWIAQLAQESRLARGQRVVNIPNVVPHETFRPMSKDEARAQFGLPSQKRLVLFSCQKVSDERKGMSYMLRALELLKEENIELVVAGSHADISTELPIHIVGYIHDEKRMAALYAAVDAFVTPSLQENLPNTIAEAMSCGTPCVGFHVGGIPEMIHHKVDGYVARFRDAEDLAEGIRHVLAHPELGEAAAQYAHETYNGHRIAQLYLNEYGTSH